MTGLTRDIVGHALVTGAGGFIGSHLTESLIAASVEVTALDLELEAVRHLDSSARCRMLEGSIEEPGTRLDALSGVDTIFHLAAAHLGTLQSTDEFRRINVDATRSLAAESLQTGARRFVHCSSVGVYGRIESPPADEESPCHPELPYEQTKLEGEEAIRQLVVESHLPAVILRPAWVYGPDCHRTTKLFETIGAGRFLVAGKGDSFRHCIFIDDMVTALIQAATHENVLGETLLIADNEPVTIRFLVDEIARLTGSSPPKSIPFPLFSALAAASEFAFKAVNRESPVSRRSLRFFTGNTAFSTDKAQEMMGLCPRFDLTRGLAETYRRLQNEL